MAAAGLRPGPAPGAMEVIRAEGGEAVLQLQAAVELPVAADGARVLTLLEATMLAAARSTVGQPSPERLCTNHMNVTFVLPADGDIEGVARVLYRVRAGVFCKGSVYGRDGELLAHAVASFSDGLP